MCSGIHYGIFSYQELPPSSSGLVSDDDPPVLIGERYCSGVPFMTLHLTYDIWYMLFDLWLVERFELHTWIVQMKGDLATLWKVTLLHFLFFGNSWLDVKHARQVAVGGSFRAKPRKTPWGIQHLKSPSGSNQKRIPVGPAIWRAGHEVMKESNFLLTSAWDASWKLPEVAWIMSNCSCSCVTYPDFGNSWSWPEVFRLCMPKSKVL